MIALFHLQVCAKGRKSSASQRGFESGSRQVAEAADQQTGAVAGQTRLRLSIFATKGRDSSFGFDQKALGRVAREDEVDN
jgi:hypothetical protein